MRTQRRVFKRLLCAAMAALGIAGMLPGITMAEEEPETVKVGFFAFDGYHMMDDNGVLSGYGYEMLQHLAGYAGFRYEFVGYDKSWQEMQDMLERGEIDILTSAQKTPEREERFDFSTDNIGISTAMLSVKAGNDKYLYGNYSGWSGMRIGLLTGSSRNDGLAEFAADHGFSFQSVYYESIEEMVADLQAGNRIDAILTSNLRRTAGERVLAQFGSSPFYIMVRKGNTELLNKIDAAITMVDRCEPGLRTALMNRYYASATGEDISFTVEERAYIKQMSGTTFTALINPDRAPYSSIQNGELSGIAYDAAEELVRRSGLNVEFLRVKDREEYQQRIDTAAADLRFDTADSYYQAGLDGYWLTVSYASVPVARLFRKTTTSFRTAAMPLSKDILDMTNKADLSIVYYPSINEAIEAVKSGKQDVSYLAADSATMAVRDDVTNRLVAEELFGSSVSYSIAVNCNQDPMLYAIMNKVAASFQESDFDQIRQKYVSSYQKPFSAIGYMYDHPMRVVSGVVIVMGVALLAVAFVFTLRRRKVEHAQMEQEKRRNELLNAALAAAEKAGAAKSQFLSSVSHEMRTPLNAIIGFMELSKDADAEQAAACLGNAELAAKQLLNVINDVLDMSSIESGKMRIANVPFNFKKVISTVTSIYGTQCRQKGISFETRMKSVTEDWMMGDELRVSQILSNLLGNAVKFTSEGHIWLTISETSVAEDKLFLCFEVTDTGCGMNEDMQARLFKPFEQESVSTANRYGGSGLGLSIVKNLVGLMDGSIHVESQQGKGSTFIVELPFTRCKRADAPGAAALSDKLRVLAVDNSEGEREYIGQVLSRLGVRFTSVDGGKAALNELDAADSAGDAYNVCLVDWRMPEMSGEETTRRIREKFGSDLVVIVVSAYDFDQAGETARKAGANLFLSKPVFQSSLFDLLMKVTGGGIAKPEEELPAWDFCGKRILLAEDNVLNQIVAKGYLAKFNVVVELAENGKRAVEMFLASAPGYYDAILMDIQMPVMDGFEATKAIRASSHESAKTIPIIAQTADAFDEDIAKALSAGMNAHIAKPIKSDTLAKALAKALQRR